MTIQQVNQILKGKRPVSAISQAAAPKKDVAALPKRKTRKVGLVKLTKPKLETNE